jgi:hypothetical protein
MSHSRDRARPKVPVAPGQEELARRADEAAGVGALHGTIEAGVALPPARLVEDRVVVRPGGGEGLGGVGERRAARLLPAHVERSRLVDAVALRQERIPVDRAEQGPHRHGADVGALGLDGLGRVPDLHEPAQLLVAGAAVVRLRDGDGPAVALPDLAQARGGSDLLGRQRHAHRLGVGEAMPAVAAPQVLGVAAQALVEEALAREIVIDADDVGGGVALEEQLEVGLGHAGVDEPAPERVLAVDASAQEVEGEPAALVVVLGLIGELRRREGLAEVVGLDELGVGPDLADGAHGEHGRLAFVGEGAKEALVVLRVRIPVAVQRAEARRRQGLVDGRVHLEVGVALRRHGGVRARCSGKASSRRLV